MNTATTTGTIDWSMRTGGRLAAAERRRLVADLARVQVRNAVGRLSLLAQSSTSNEEETKAAAEQHAFTGRTKPKSSKRTRK